MHRIIAALFLVAAVPFVNGCSGSGHAPHDREVLARRIVQMKLSPQECDSIETGGLGDRLARAVERCAAGDVRGAVRILR